MAEKKKNRWLNFFKKWHRWPSLIFSLFFLFWALSGIILNHRSLFSGADIARNYLPEEYRYRDWNNAALKSAVKIGKDSLLLFGNIGVWLTDNTFSTYEDFNRGFPKGIDNRKIYCLIHTVKGNLYAGTLFGLYSYDWGSGSWNKISLPVNHDRICSLREKEGRILVMTRSEIFESTDDPRNFHPSRIQLPPPVGYTNKEGVFRTFWVIHSGEIYGVAGRLIVDVVGIILIILTITGLIHYFAPFIIRKRKRKKLSLEKVTHTKRFSTKWHKKLGIWIALLLLINVITGMFLRPPMLISIANSKMIKIPYSLLDSPNAWDDKLRDFIFDDPLNGYLVSTSEGLFFCRADFSGELIPIPGQPPVSVMGINALERNGDNSYLVGSFSGLFRWSPGHRYTENYLTGKVPEAVNTSSRPLSDNMVSGYLEINDGREYYMDYNLGAIPVHHHSPFPPMPEKIIKDSPMSLWNLALEFHTARIWKVFLGDFYILIIPLMGVFGTILLLSGFVVWMKLFRRKKSCSGNKK